MTTMIAPAAVKTPIQNEALNDVQDTAQAKASPAKRRKYSGNDVLRLRKILDEVKMDMDKQCLSMNDVVHLLQDRLDEMLKNYKCSCAELARRITKACFPVSERTLKDYLARARKDAKEGHTVYSELKEHILSQAAKEDGSNSANDAAPCLSGEADASDAQDASDDLAASSATDTIEAKEMARQHVQDIYAARKRRKRPETPKSRSREN